MKKSILTTVTFIIGLSLTSCQNSAEKVEKAEEKVQDANEDLATAKQEYLEDMENYRREMDVRFEDNDRSIREFNDRFEKEKKDVKSEYRKRLAELEERNKVMKSKMADYKADSKANWESFKAEFNHDMQELGNALRDLGNDNVKDQKKDN